MKRYMLAGFLLFLAIGGLVFWFGRQSNATTAGYRTEEVKRTDLLVSFSCTGTVEPEDVVDVGTQVAGMITQFGVGPDGKPIDYRSPVEPGTILALIDDSLFRAKVQQSQAQVNSSERLVDSMRAKLDQAKAKAAQARATTELAEANVVMAKAKWIQAGKDLARAKQLEPRGSISVADVDAAQAANDTNKAGVSVAEAALEQSKAAELDAEAAIQDAKASVATAEATVALNKAMLHQDQINLGYCTIKSTVKGTIIDRRVTIGQTVQSSFNTPSLFLIAKDMKRMKVWASVNEADVSQVSLGQPVTFVVDAYPNETFSGSVSLIRLNAINTQNVVTYTVEVLTDNASGKLLPYMTANLRFQMHRHENVLVVSNTALRFRPADDRLTPEVRQAIQKKEKPTGKSGATSDNAIVWTEENGSLKPIRVKVGLSDGKFTEITGGDLAVGTKLITGEARVEPEENPTNPFAMKKLGGKKQQ